MLLFAIALSCLNLACGQVEVNITLPGPHFYEEVSVKYDGLVLIPVKELSQCFTQCLFLEQCTVVSFDDYDKQCFIQMNSEVQEITYPPRYKTYKNTRGTQDWDDLCWKKLSSQRTKGFTQAKFDPLRLCMLYCIGTKVCNAITYDSDTSPSCWVQLSSDTASVTVENFEYSPTTDSYLLDKACLDVPTYLPKL